LAPARAVGVRVRARCFPGAVSGPFPHRGHPCRERPQPDASSSGHSPSSRGMIRSSVNRAGRAALGGRLPVGRRAHVPSTTGAAVDELAQDVGVTSVARRLFEEVHQDPAQVDRSLVPDISARLVEARGRRHDGVGAGPGGAVVLDGSGEVSSGCTVSSGRSTGSPAKRCRIHNASARDRCFISQSRVVPLPTRGCLAAASSTPVTFRTIESR